MERQLSSLTMIVLLACGAGAGFAYAYLSRPQTAAAASTEALPAPTPHVAPTNASVSMPIQQAAPVAAADPVSAWIEDAAGEDPGRRVAAIAALGDAPAARALAVLQQVLNSGDAVDRPLALNALRKLALRDGDAAGGIRELLRVEVYDGNDEDFVPSVQAVLAELDDRLVALR
jgi:hypothetical protein